MGTTKHVWNAEEYAKNSSAQFQWAQELIEKLGLRGDESLLDIGCGDGKISAQIARIVTMGRVVGLDASAEMIRLANESFPAILYPNLTFIQQDATAIALGETFDVVFSNATLHWVKDHVAVLRGIHGCLRKGGRILLQMAGIGNARELFAIVSGKVIATPRWRHYFADFVPPYFLYGAEEYELWLVQCGFRPDRIELIEKDMQHSGREGFKGWLKTTWFPYTDCLPVELRELFLDEFVSAYTSTRPLDAEGYSHVDMVRLEVEATVV